MLPTLSYPPVGPVDPVLLDQRDLEAELGGRRGDLTGVVGLDAADADEGVAALGEGVGEEVPGGLGG